MTQRDVSDGKPRPESQIAEKNVQRLGDYALLISQLVHEFRTPLSSIVGGASILDQYSERLDGPAKSRICTGIMDQARRLDTLFTALAAIARARTVTLVRQEQVFELNELLRGLWAADPNSSDSPGGISLLREEVFLETDPAVIRTILSLMLGLAAFYSPVDRDASLSLTLDGERVAVVVESGVRADEAARLSMLLDGRSSAASLQPEARCDAICLAAIQEIVNSLGEVFDIQYKDADGRLSQTVKLKTSNVPAGPGEA